MAQPIKHKGKWRIRPIDEQGQRLSLTFDTYKDAAHELKKIEIRVEEKKRGIDRPPPKGKDKTIGDLCDYWIKMRVPNKRSGREDESIIRVHLRPTFGETLIQDFGTRHVDDFLNRRKHLDKQTTNHHLKLLISLLKLAVDLHWLEEHKRPKIKKAKVPKYPKDFRYLKSQEEIQRFLNAAREHGEHTFAVYATAIFTGMRLGEIVALEKTSVDFEKRLISVKQSHEGETKSGEDRVVPILDPLLPVLRNWFIKCPGRLVFTNRAGKMHRKDARVFRSTLHNVLAGAGFPKLQIKNKYRAYVRFHDLRHSFASHWMMNGGCIFRLQKILGHETPEMTMRYSHLSPEVYSSDYGRINIDLTESKVLRFPNAP